MKMNTVRKSLQSSSTRIIMMAGLALLAVVVAWAILALALRADTSTTASFQAEAGTKTGVTTISDTQAAGGSAVQFGAVATGGDSTCPAFPAFPNEACTGPPTGYSLTTVANLSSTANGQVIDGMLVNGDITVSHNNVTIKNSRVKGAVMAGSRTGLVLQNVDVGPDTCPGSPNGNRFAVNANGYTLRQTHIHNIPNDPLRVAGGAPYVIEDSIVDKTCFYPDDHLDAIQWYNPGGVGNVSIIHSVIDVRPQNNPSNTGNAALFWADGAGSGTTLTMYNNKFAGGGYTTALYDAVKGSGVIMDVHDNVYVKNSYAYAPCSFGSSPKSIVFDGTSGVKFINNKLDDGTAVTCG